MSPHRHAASERSFGITVGIAFCAVAAVLAWRGRATGMTIALFAGAMLIALGLVAPTLLVWPSAAWWRLSRVLGWVTTRIWLTVLFLVVVVPVGLVWRLTGHDPLGKARGRATGWSAYPARYRNPRHFLRMY